MKKIIFAALLVVLLVSCAIAFDGEEKWHVKLDAPISSGIAVTKDALLFGDASGTFYSINREDGAKIWDYNGSGSICGLPVFAGEAIIFAQADGEITSLKISDGSLIWKNPPADYNSAMNDGIAKGDGRIYAAKNDSKLYALDITDGKTLWTYTAKQALRTAPAYSDGLVFQGEYDGIFSILEAKSGKRLNGGGAGGAVNTPVIVDGNVYFSGCRKS